MTATETPAHEPAWACVRAYPEDDEGSDIRVARVDLSLPALDTCSGCVTWPRR